MKFFIVKHCLNLIIMLNYPFDKRGECMELAININNIQEKYGTYLEQFLKSLDVKKSSKNTYRKQMKEFFVWTQKNNVNAPDRDDILSYKEYLYNDKMLSSLTVAGYLTAVRRFFEWLESIKIYPNVAKGIKNPKIKPGFKKDVLTLEQAKQLLNSMDRSTIIGKRNYAMVNLMLRTGLRTIEISRACKDDISRQGGEPVLHIHGKGRDSKDEIVVLTPATLGPIKEYFKARKTVRDREPIFVSHSKQNPGKKLSTRTISQVAKDALIDIGLNDSRLTAHSLRHTAITFSLLAGASTQETRLLARHSNINTTLIYAHNINRVKDAPEHKIDEFLD